MHVQVVQESYFAHYPLQLAIINRAVELTKRIKQIAQHVCHMLYVAGKRECMYSESDPPLSA